MPLPRPTRHPHQSKETEKPADTALDPASFRPSDVFRFDPKPDITPDELAHLVSIFWTLDLNFDRFFALDSELQRHFEAIKIEKNR